MTEFPEKGANLGLYSDAWTALIWLSYSKKLSTTTVQYREREKKEFV